MQLLLPVVAIVIIATISVFSPKKAIPSENSEANLTPTAKPTHTTTPTPSSHILTPTIINDSPKPTATPASNNDSSSTNNYIYPGATVVSSSEKNIELTSTDDATTITNWYKDKIQSDGLNATSFVTTNTNDNINNVLAGGKNNKEIKISITKNASESKVTIKIELKNS